VKGTTAGEKGKRFHPGLFSSTPVTVNGGGGGKGITGKKRNRRNIWIGWGKEKNDKVT